MRRLNLVIGLIAVSVLFSGCSSYRASSNIQSSGVSASPLKNVAIFEGGNQPSEKYRTTQSVEVSIKKLTAFHDDPTKEQANAELKKRASAIGCDAVVNVAYKAGVGFTTWGYLDAQGYCAFYE